MTASGLVEELSWNFKYKRQTQSINIVKLEVFSNRPFCSTLYHADINVVNSWNCKGEQKILEKPNLQDENM